MKIKATRQGNVKIIKGKATSNQIMKGKATSNHHFDHENQGNEHESDPRPRSHWSPDNSNSTDGNVHENINRGVSTGFTFQRTGACTQKSCKFMHVHPNRPYPSFQSYQYNQGLISIPTNNQITWKMKVQS